MKQMTLIKIVEYLKIQLYKAYIKEYVTKMLKIKEKHVPCRYSP